MQEPFGKAEQFRTNNGGEPIGCNRTAIELTDG